MTNTTLVRPERLAPERHLRIVKLYRDREGTNILPFDNDLARVLWLLVDTVAEGVDRRAIIQQLGFDAVGAVRERSEGPASEPIAPPYQITAEPLLPQSYSLPASFRVEPPGFAQSVCEKLAERIGVEYADLTIIEG